MVLAVDQQELRQSDSPLSLVFGKGTPAAAAMTAIGILAGLNGALVQIIMASRVAYGMAQKRQAPRAFSKLSVRTQTPLLATGAVTLIWLVLALWLPIEALAKATSTILLMVYAVVNISLIVIKRREHAPPEEGPSYPVWIPIVGCCACVGFLLVHAAAVWL